MFTIPKFFFGFSQFIRYRFILGFPIKTVFFRSDKLTKINYKNVIKIIYNINHMIN